MFKKSGFIGMILLLCGCTFLHAQDAPKARQAVFIQSGDKVWVYRVPPGTTRVEPQVEYLGSHYETQTIYIGNVPTFQSILVPDYRNLGDKLILSMGEQERTFTNAKWRTVDVIDKDGYKYLQARIDAENAANDFGLRKYELKQRLLDALLDEPVEVETRKLNRVLEVVLSTIH